MNINAQLISKLRKDYGDAFYLLNSDQFKINFTKLKKSFQKVYPNFNIAYSYKTNYTPRLCAIINELGGFAEVVSEMELEIAFRVGVKPENIIWNGPIKNAQTVESFMTLGGTVNIDSIEELAIIQDISNRNQDKKLRIGIRCNFDIGDGVLSRFGFDIEGDDFKQTIIFVRSTPNIILNNFHCHYANRQLEYWPARARGMISIIERFDIIPECIDIGGGLYGNMEDSLKAQFKGEIPNYESYARASAVIFSDYFKNRDIQPKMIIEPGSALVGDCMRFVGTVKSIKNIRGKWIASVMGSQKNISMHGVNPPIEIIKMTSEQKEYKNLDFVGFTCIEDDVIHKNFNGFLAREDAIVISNCGSYSIVMKPPFILPNFPILEVCENGNVEVVKRGETFDDLFQSFSF